MATLPKRDDRHKRDDRDQDPEDLSTDLNRSGDFESLYPDEELITRPSVGQRMLVAMGYLLPIILGAGLGLWIADIVFS